MIPRPDGLKARCGGPAICAQCAREAAQQAAASVPPQRDAASDGGHWNFSACIDRFGNIHADVNVGGGPGAASHTTGASSPPATVARLLRELADDIELAPYRLPDGTWACTRGHVTRPCGNCDGCRWIASVNAARREENP